MTALLWDLTLGEATGKLALTEAAFARLWHDLHNRDAAIAYRAHWRLVAAAAEAVPLLAKRLRPVPAPDAERVAALVRELANEGFDARSGAHTELQKLGELAEPALRAGLKQAKELETRRRIEVLLRRISEVSPERLAQVRVVEVLERAQSAAAVALLRELATGYPAASVTRAASEAVFRLQK